MIRHEVSRSSILVLAWGSQYQCPEVVDRAAYLTRAIRKQAEELFCFGMSNGQPTGIQSTPLIPAPYIEREEAIKGDDE